MNEDEEFDARVDKLAQADEMMGAARVIARASEGGVARAVLNAVDETILPAELTFASEAGDTLTLSAAARRLRSVSAASDGLSPGDVPGQELDTEDEAGMRAALDLLDRFAGRASGAVVVSESRAEENSARGVSAKRLMGMLAEEAVPSAPGDAAAPDRFLAELGERAFASLLRASSGVETSTGQPDHEAQLTMLADGANRDSGPVLDLWLGQTDAASGPAFGRGIWSDGSIVALVFDAPDVAEIVSAFRGSTGS